MSPRRKLPGLKLCTEAMDVYVFNGVTKKAGKNEGRKLYENYLVNNSRRFSINYFILKLALGDSIECIHVVGELTVVG